jgi:enoyl-CoA hydratase/carnithine racemase
MNCKRLIAAVHGYAIGHAVGTALLRDLHHARIVAGNFNWAQTDGFKNAIRARAGG